MLVTTGGGIKKYLRVSGEDTSQIHANISRYISRYCTCIDTYVKKYMVKIQDTPHLDIYILPNTEKK